VISAQAHGSVGVMARMRAQLIKRMIAALITLTVASAQAPAQQNPEKRLRMMFSVGQNEIYVAAHRGDWRDAPENSILALRYAEQLGVDIVEIDLKKTKDDQLVVMHDKTLDRTTTGSGAVSDYSLAELKRLKLRSGTGHPTTYQIPTFSEELTAARDNVIINIDQGWAYFPDVLKELRATRTAGQVIFNVLPDTSYEEFERREGAIPEDLTVMIVVNMSRPDARAIIQSYRPHKRTIVQCIFADDQLASVLDMPAYRQQSPVWINSLWPELNAGHDDDRAVDRGQKDQSWGWLISRGAEILQTDRPKDLLEYLRQKKLRGSEVTKHSAQFEARCVNLAE
jgi:glycerophosphoryl diester phosphodiesterase